MSQRRIIDGPQELAAAVGTELGTSDWILIDQPLIDRFAEVTGDDYWGHVDPERSRSTPFGTTIAHGLLTLSLHPRLLYAMVEFHGFEQLFHYGYDKVRFPSSVPVGARVQMVATLTATRRISGGTRGSIRFEFRSDASQKPACVAEYVQYFMHDDGADDAPPH